jgi:hypothetical protein
MNTDFKTTLIHLHDEVVMSNVASFRPILIPAISSRIDIIFQNNRAMCRSFNQSYFRSR